MSTFGMIFIVAAALAAAILFLTFFWDVTRHD